MKYLYLVFVLSISLIAEAQSDRKKQETDSLEYYNRELGILWRAKMDSLVKSEPYIAALAGKNRHLKLSSDYTSFTLFFDVFGADYSQLNSMLAQDGFPALEETGGRFGFGTSVKSGRAIVDLYFIVAGFSNKSEKGNERVSTSFSNVLHVDPGGLIPYSSICRQ